MGVYVRMAIADSILDARILHRNCALCLSASTLDSKDRAAPRGGQQLIYVSPRRSSCRVLTSELTVVLKIKPSSGALKRGDPASRDAFVYDVQYRKQ
jgi:hypothetical protein